MGIDGDVRPDASNSFSPVKNETIFPKTLAINHFYFGSPEDAKPLG